MSFYNSTKDFDNEIYLIFKDNKLVNVLSSNARKFAKNTFDELIIAKQYLNNY